MRIFTLKHRKIMLCMFSAGWLLFNATANAQSGTSKATKKVLTQSKEAIHPTIANPLGPAPPLTGPAGISDGIQLWLDGSDVNADGSVPANGSVLPTWKDKSGLENNAAVVVGQSAPLYFINQINGKSVLRFSRIADNLGTVYKTPVDIRPDVNQDITVFTVYTQGLLTGDNPAPWGADNGNWDRFFISSLGGAINGIAAFGPAPPYGASIAGSGIAGTTRLLTSVYDGQIVGDDNFGPLNASAIYFNGRLVTSFTDRTHAYDQKPNFYLGWDGDNSAFNGDIAEVIVYKRKLSNCEIATINKYLAVKYAQDFNYNTISISGSANICAGATTKLTASAATGYQWLFNDAPILGATAMSYDAALAGNYRVVINTAGNCADTSDAINITVLPSPDGNITVSGSTSFCPGGSVLLTAMPDANSYEWYMDGSAIPLETSQTYLATQSGKYTVAVSNANGCTVTTPETNGVKVLQYPFLDPSIETSGPTTICEGDTVELQVKNPATSYQWFKDGRLIPGAVTRTFKAFQSGNYWVGVTTPEGCYYELNELGIKITVNQRLHVSVNIAAMSPQVCPGTAVTIQAATQNAGDAPVFIWKVNNVPVGNNDSVFTYSALAPGDSVTVTLISNAVGCLVNSPAVSQTVYIKLDGNGDCDSDGILNSVECPTGITGPDTDGDGQPDYLDTDSDNDGLADSLEKGANGLAPVDTDNDGTADFRDTDSDNDSMTDLQERGADARNPVDSDSDGKPDHLDTDSDNDRIADSIENNLNGVFAIDTDADGKADYLDIDSDNDGISDELEKRTTDNTATDTDADGVYDFRDLDSDNDGLSDNLEKGGDSATPADTDSDGKPDYVDTDSDNDGIFDTVEKGVDAASPVDTDLDGTPDYRDTDSDNDGLSDSVGKGSNGMAPKDTDGDGVADYLDADSDNDGLADRIEKTDDCDRDGIPNYMDADKCGVGIYVPDAFTPNGDGQNDIIAPVIPGVETFRYFRVYNRWGNLVFQTNTANQGWDGRFKGQLQPQDTYIWIAEGLERNGAKIVNKGILTLVR